MKKSLAIAILAVFTGAAYAGSALEQLGVGNIELQPPAPTAVEAVQKKAAMPCSAPSVCVGDRVVDSTAGAGTVKEVFTNGTAKVRFDKYNGYYYRNTRDLGVGVECISGVCRNNRVVDSADGAGMVKEVFTNGTAKVRFDEYIGYYYLDIKDLGVGVECVSGVCENNRVVNSTYGAGKVGEVFTNGIAKVRFDKYIKYYYLSIKDLGAASLCD